VRNLILGLFCLVLAGCAASTSSSVSTSESTPQNRQAVQADPLTEEQQAMMNNARRAMNEERWGAAIASLEALEHQRPEVAEIHASLAWIARQQGNPEQAMAAYRTAFELDPGDAVSANNLALLLREQNQFREAVTLLQEGLRYSPDTADLHYNLAVIAELYLLDLELALAHYRKFRALTEQEGQLVAGWIADLERRLD
jgi:Flp pilus assembly protein TadD